MHIVFDDDTKLFKIVMIDNKLNINEFFAHNSNLDTNKYLNVKEENNKINGYILVKYKVSSNELYVGVIDYKAVKKLILNKTILGKTPKGDLFSTVYITENQNKLQNFIKKNDKNLFPRMVKFKKIVM